MYINLEKIKMERNGIVKKVVLPPVVDLQNLNKSTKKP